MRSINEGGYSNLFKISLLIFLAVFTFYSTVDNGFINNYDDDVYVTNNIDIVSGNIINLLTKYYSGHYHPVTMLSFYLDYLLFEFNPFGYHLINVIIHTLNGILVFFLLSLLSNNKNVVFITSILFLIHPLSVESVAWISERKNLLYTFFYLFSFISFYKYVKKNKIYYYFFALALFLLAMLSKVSAATFPVIILIFVLIFNRKNMLRNIFLILPYFGFSFLFGYLALDAQGLTDWYTPDFNFLEHVLVSNYALLFYIGKIVLPINLSTFHYYPMLYDLDGLRVCYPYLLITFSVLLSLYVFRNHFKKTPKIILFLISFFLFNIFLVILKFPKGVVFAAERYTYLASFSFIFIYIYYLEKYLKIISFKYFKWTLLCSVSFIIIFFYLQTNKRISVWENIVTVYSDAMIQYPSAHYSYYIVGKYFYENGDYNESLKFLNKCLQVKPDSYNSMYMIGVNYVALDNLEKAEFFLKKAMEVNASEIKVYPMLARVLFENSSKLNVKRIREAIYYSSLAINNYPESELIINRGVAFYKLGEFQKAINDFNESLKINNNQIGLEEFLIGQTYFDSNEADSACFYWHISKTKGYNESNQKIINFCSQLNI